MTPFSLTKSTQMNKPTPMQKCEPSKDKTMNFMDQKYEFSPKLTASTLFSSDYFQRKMNMQAEGSIDFR